MDHLEELPAHAVPPNMLPNPAIMMRAYGDLQEEVGKFSNLPALDHGQALVAAINNQFELMRNNLNEKFEGINERFEGINERFEGINERFDRLENQHTNTIARTQNSLLSTDTDELFPLVNIRNGQAIEYFPHTSNELDRMTAAQLRAVLSDLGAGATLPRLVEDLRKSLRVQLGLKGKRKSPP